MDLIVFLWETFSVKGFVGNQNNHSKKGSFDIVKVGIDNYKSFLSTTNF